MSYVYHICSKSAWEEAKKQGIYKGTAHDQKDGFIHMSAPHQVERTALKYYAQEQNLLLLKIDPTLLSAHLTWEENSKGEIFPHYYVPLFLQNIKEVLEFSPQTFVYADL